MRKTTQPISNRERVLKYAFAVLMIAIATYGRVLLIPVIGDRLPFGMYTLEVILVAWIGGVGPAVLALIASILCAAHFVIPPEHSLAIVSPADQFGLLIFFTVGIVSIVMFSRFEDQHQKALEQVISNQQLNAELTQRDKQKDEFLALLAHELRSPLAPIGNSIALLERELGAAHPARQTINRLSKNFTHLVRLVNDLLDVSRYLRDTIELQRETTNVSECIQAAIEMTQSELQSRQHSLIVDIPDQPAFANIDPVRICQVVTNLVSNAIKYTPDRGRIIVRLKRQSAGIIIEVQDNGLGIPDTIQDNVFTPFFQANPKQSRFAPGLGLGLSIVRKIVELHGGGIEVISLGANNGSQFIVSLPSLMPEEADDPQAPFVIPALPGVQADQDSRVWSSNLQSDIGFDTFASAHSSNNVSRVLIVDDDHDTAETLSRLLSMDGYDTRIASTGLEAIAVFRQCHPKFVLLDIGLPELDGYEVAKRLRQETPNQPLKIIAVSGWGAESDLKKGKAAGFDAHLVKPIRLDELLTHLHPTNAVEA